MGPELLKFVECGVCSVKPGTPALCPSCLHNRHVIETLNERLKSPAMVEELERRGVIPHNHDFLARLREMNLNRLPRFGHGRIDDVGAWGAMQWGCALAGETGELCNVLKKYDRQMPTDPSRDDLSIEIAAEIADVAIYLDLLASYFAFDMRRLITTKFNRTSAKFGFPERL